MDHFFTGAFIRRRIQFMAKSQLFQPGIARLGLQPRGRVPGSPRLPRRGGIHHRVSDPRSRRRGRHVLRGRSLADRQGRRPGQARDRAARAGVRRAGRPGGDPRLTPGAQLEAPAVPPRDRPVRRPVQVPARRRDAPASSSRRPPTTSWSGSRRCTPSSSASAQGRAAGAQRDARRATAGPSSSRPRAARYAVAIVAALRRARALDRRSRAS